MNNYNSIFGQILSLFPRIQFEALIKETRSDKRIKEFTCGDQFVAMLFCQLEQAQALREICEGLATSLGKMILLRMKKAPSRSALAYANEHRPWQLHQKLFFYILGIRLTGFYSKKKCPFVLRRVVYRDSETGKKYECFTNNMTLAASTIASIYIERWQIETFFKALKQNFCVKTFVGTSFNAVMIQIWTALIAILILKYLKARSKITWSLANLVALLRMNLLTYVDLWDWLDHPYFSPPIRDEAVQESFAFCCFGQHQGDLK